MYIYICIYICKYVYVHMYIYILPPKKIEKYNPTKIEINICSIFLLQNNIA